MMGSAPMATESEMNGTALPIIGSIRSLSGRFRVSIGVPSETSLTCSGVVPSALSPLPGLRNHQGTSRTPKAARRHVG